MLVAHNMTDVYRSVNTDRSWPNEVIGELEAVIALAKREVSELGDPAEDLVKHFGGAFYLVETVDDLDEIFTSVESSLAIPLKGSGGWASLKEKPCTFEWMYYLPSKDYIFLFNATNNDGGPSYHIPRHVFGKCSNVEDSLIMSVPDEKARIHSIQDDLK